MCLCSTKDKKKKKKKKKKTRKEKETNGFKSGLKTAKLSICLIVHTPAYPLHYTGDETHITYTRKGNLKQIHSCWWLYCVNKSA